MASVLRAVAHTGGKSLLALAAALAMASGVISAIGWACDRLGTTLVIVVSAFIAGAIVALAIDRGVAEARAKVGPVSAKRTTCQGPPEPR